MYTSRECRESKENCPVRQVFYVPHPRMQMGVGVDSFKQEAKGQVSGVVGSVPIQMS